jgi:diguanylate cyclase (GGDEF)-like protein
MVCEADKAPTLTEQHESAMPAGDPAFALAHQPDVSDQNLQPIQRAARTDWRLASWLGVCFAVPIVIMMGVGYWASNRVLSVDHAVDLKIESRLTKLQMVHQAMRYSNENNAITTRFFLEKNASPEEVLARRNENSRRVTEIIANLEAQSDSERERQLLTAVKETRAPYLTSYRYALQALLAENNPAKAQSVMLGRVMPELYGYRLAWDDLASFEMEQIKVTNEQGEEVDRKTRRVALTIVWLAGFCAAGIGAFATSRIVADAKDRTRMQEELSTLNAMLERRVAQRTEELARAQDQLRESLSETQAYTREIEAINELVKLLQSCLTLEEARKLAARVLQQFFAAGSLLLLNSSRNLLDTAFTWGNGESKAGPFPPESCWALRKGERHLVQPRGVNLICEHSAESSAASHLCLPMIAQGDSLGVLSIDDSSLCECVSDARAVQRKLRLAETLSEQIGLAFANLQLRDTLKYQSLRDSLTGLFNRRHMEESLERELLRAARSQTPVTVLMIDIDHFKRFNDVYGHGAGDLLLRELGAVLRSLVRGGDISCRYGGEEFLMIMAETSLEAGYQRAQNIRQQVTGLQVRYHGETLRKITVSIGVAGFPVNGEAAGTIVKAADEALYRAKREGRDRVVVAENKAAQALRRIDLGDEIRPDQITSLAGL